MAAHIGVSDFFVQKAIHAGSKNTFFETVLRPGFGQFISPLLSPCERRRSAAVHIMSLMKELVEESIRRHKIRRNVLSFKLGNIEAKRGEAFRFCIETLACCRMIVSRHRVLAFNDPVSGMPIALSNATVFDPVPYSPKKLKDALSLSAPTEYEHEFSELVTDFSMRLPHFMKFNFGNEIDIYANNPSKGKAPKKGISSCDICMKITKNSSYRTQSDNIITNHHILPARYGGSNAQPFITNICAPCHNDGGGIESIIHSFEDAARKMRIGQKIGLFGKHRDDNAEAIAQELARSPYPKIYPVDFLALYSNAVALAMVLTYFKGEDVIRINKMSRDRLLNGIAPIILDLWQRPRSARRRLTAFFFPRGFFFAKKKGLWQRGLPCFLNRHPESTAGDQDENIDRKHDIEGHEGPGRDGI